MKICVPLAEMMVSLNPELYSPIITEEQGEPIFCKELLKSTIWHPTGRIIIL
jgi:hypothetical protein